MTHSLDRRLSRAADEMPAQEAVRDSGTSLTYGELETQADALAIHLQKLGVQRGDRVGLLLNKSAASVVAVYGIMRSGACYVPLDPLAPPHRTGGIAADAGIDVLLSSHEKTAEWHALTEAGARIKHITVLDGAGEPPGGPSGVTTHAWAEVLSEQGQGPSIRHIGEDLAYILYTSGSTGRPKGVMLTHINALTFIDWAVRHYGVTSDDVLSSHAPLHFDLSTFDLFAASSAGAPVVLVPPEASVFPAALAAFLEKERISTWYSVPSILSVLAMRGKLQDRNLGSLRNVLFAGEVFPTKYLRSLMQQLPGVTFGNLYGPTETNVCTYYDVPPLAAEDDRDIPIGKAIDGVELFVIDEAGHPVSVDEVGELWVRGPSVLRGYWNDPERTAAARLRNPFVPGADDPLYRTGDLVKTGVDGNLTFLGRRDSQIKSRGYRIELGEIQAALYAHPSILECAVLAVPDPLISNRIVAFVSTAQPMSAEALAKHCSELVPRYMVPERFESLPELPKTSTGKLDRQTLLARVARTETS